MYDGTDRALAKAKARINLSDSLLHRPPVEIAMTTSLQRLLLRSSLYFRSLSLLAAAKGCPARAPLLAWPSAVK